MSRNILRRNCLLRRVIEGKIQGGIEVTGRQGRRRRKLLDDLKERRGYSHLKEEALDRTMWRARFGRGFGPVVRQTNEWISETERFSKEKVIEHRMCVLIFATTYVWNISYSKNNRARYHKKMCIGLQVKYRLVWSYFNDTLILSSDFRKILQYKSHQNLSSGSRVVPCRRTDRLIWRS